MTRVGVMSDTHAPRFWKSCPSAVGQVLRGGDVILHAGDVCTVDVLDDLSTFAPVHAVLGNDGAAIANRGAPVVFGHSHIPWVELGEGFRVFNPGPPTGKRRQPHGTSGILEIDAGRLVSARGHRLRCGRLAAGWRA